MKHKTPETAPAALGYAYLHQGRWYACVRVLQGGLSEGKTLMLRMSPQPTLPAAMALAFGAAQRVNSGDELLEAIAVELP